MRVSIVIPVYNAKDFIIECLDSIANQTMTEGIECVLVEDCGQDASAEIIEEYIQNYKGNISFRLFKQEKNQGPSAARNRGVKEASGKYIFFLDSDDSLASNCIEMLYALAEKYDVDYVQGTYISDEHYHMPYYDEAFDGNPNNGSFYKMPEFSNDKSWIKSTLLNYNIIPFTPHNRLVRREFLLEHSLFFNQKLKVREDFYWMFFLAKYVDRIAISVVPAYYRGFNAESLTHNINIEREITANLALIEDFSANIDPFLRGRQKELLLDVFIFAHNAFGINNIDRKKYEKCLREHMTFVEKIVFNIYLKAKISWWKTKIHHLLVRMFKICDIF